MPETEPDDEILDSWKEIAVFLRRGVRTVQRWERLEGLPVRRHDHLKRGSVYALRSEVALWVRTRQFGHKGPVNTYPMYQYRELSGYIAQQRLLMDQLRDQLKTQLANVMTSWTQLKRSATQTNERVFVSSSQPSVHADALARAAQLTERWRGKLSA
jgi:hypothetical protein